MREPIADPARGKEVFDLDRAHVFHSWSAQGLISPMPVAGGAGSYFWDYDGNKYLDFSCQLVFTNIGHQHPKVVAAIQEQAAKLATIAPQHANDARAEAAKLITERAGAHHNKVFFTNGGADGIENAIRLARVHTGKHKVLSFYRSYHGNTTSAVTATGDPRRWPNEYAYGHVHFFGPYLYRTPFWSTTEEEESRRALEHLEQVIIFEGPATIAAILLESVVGTAGVLIPPAGYLEGVRALCDKYGIKWIADEVMSGFGRTGKWFAYQHSSVEPDLIVFAKGVNSGYVPLGGVVISDEIAATFNERVFPGGLTYSGHPLATAAAVATINAMTEEKMVEHAASTGETVIRPLLEELAAKHKVVGEVRGLGAFWAIELVKDRDTREPLAPYGGSSPAMGEVMAACKKAGMIPFMNFNRIHICPPLNVSEAELRTGIAALDAALAGIAGHYTGN